MTSFSRAATAVVSYPVLILGAVLTVVPFGLGLVTSFTSAEQFNTNPTSKYGNDDAVNAGFSALMLVGVPILADIFCPTGTAFFVNTKYLSLYISEDANFAFSGFHSLIPNNQIANVGVVITMMALVCTKPVSGAQANNITGAGF